MGLTFVSRANICRIFYVPKMQHKENHQSPDNEMNELEVSYAYFIDQMGYILRESSRASHKLSIESKIIQIEVPSKTLSSKYDGRQKVTIVSDYWYLSGTQNVI